MIIFLSFSICFTLVISDPLTTTPEAIRDLLSNETRRILRGTPAGETRPYMVYLRPSAGATNDLDENWTCGGVIIHEQYILTSAACIENAKQFYVISGTSKWVPTTETDNECIKNGRKKAIWKCVPRSYVYDGQDFDNIRWMIYDIAVVKVEDEFNFNRRVRGCEFIPNKLTYNNQSEDYERAGTVASIAGWGSTDKFTQLVVRSSQNSPDLLETDVVLLSNKNCKKRWPTRYHYIIDAHMICGKDSDADSMSTICSDREVNCKELVYSDEDEDEAKRLRLRLLRKVLEPEDLIARPPQKRASKKVRRAADHDGRRAKVVSGGFCENDHGGPLIVGHGKTSMVIGIISACLTRDVTNQCYGPFLYTSVYKNRHLISCAIYKELGPTCRRVLRSSNTEMKETHFEWPPEPITSRKLFDDTTTSRTKLPKINIFTETTATTTLDDKDLNSEGF